MPVASLYLNSNDHSATWSYSFGSSRLSIMALTVPFILPVAVPSGAKISAPSAPSAQVIHLAVPAVPDIERKVSVALPSLSVERKVRPRSAPALPSSRPISPQGWPTGIWKRPPVARRGGRCGMGRERCKVRRAIQWITGKG